MAYSDPLEPILATDRVGDRVERVPDHTPDVADAVVGECIDDQLSDGGHGSLLGMVVLRG
jgi:hypothetical protein